MQSRYAKAYAVADLRRFDGWSERSDAVRPIEEIVDGEPVSKPRTLRADDFLFLHEDFVVTDGVLRDQHVVFDAVDDAWRDFCARVLDFDPGAALADPEPEP